MPDQLLSRCYDLRIMEMVQVYHSSSGWYVAQFHRPWLREDKADYTGTAVVIIDQANNRTVTSTTYNETATSGFMSNGTLRTLGGRTATASSFVRAGTSNITV